MPRPGRMTTERAKDFKGTLRQLLQHHEPLQTAADYGHCLCHSVHHF